MDLRKIKVTKHAQERWQDPKRNPHMRKKDIRGVVRRHFMPALSNGLRPNHHGSYEIDLRYGLVAAVVINDQGNWVIKTVFKRRKKPRNVFARRDSNCQVNICASGRT